jgi:hypothetical protein
VIQYVSLSFYLISLLAFLSSDNVANPPYVHQVYLLIALVRCGLAASVSETHCSYYTTPVLLSLSSVYYFSLLFCHVNRKTVTDLWLFYSHPPKSGDLPLHPLIHHAASSHDTPRCLAPLLVCSSATAIAPSHPYLFFPAHPSLSAGIRHSFVIVTGILAVQTRNTRGAPRSLLPPRIPISSKRTGLPLSLRPTTRKRSRRVRVFLGIPEKGCAVCRWCRWMSRGLGDLSRTDVIISRAN